MGFEVDGHAVGAEHGLEGVGDLLPDALLDGEAPGEQAHEPGELGDADDALMGDVAHVGAAIEGQRVVLAERVELDWPLDHLAEAAIGAASALSLKYLEQL